MEAGGSFTVWEEARVDDGEAALYSIYQGLFACSMLPLALSLAVTGAPPRAGCTFWHAERTSNEEYGCEQAATPLQADQGCGAARARGATSLGHDHGPGGF